MSVELVHSQPTAASTVQRVMRMQLDAKALLQLSPAEIRTLYDRIEVLRDALSRVLDRADGKHA